jgi:hypothetical protein
MEKVLANEKKPPSIRPPPSKTCYKQDPERMKDLKKWKFVRPELLGKNIESVCGADWKDPGKDGFRIEYNIPKTQPVDQWDHGLNEWSHVAIHVGAGARKENCLEALGKINNDCDHDASPLDQNMNQFNFKWGGEVVDNAGAKWTIEPLRERVYTTKDIKGWKCYVRPNGLFSQNGDKGNNGRELNDEARMALTMCVHNMHQAGSEGKDNIDCGGLMKTGMRRVSLRYPTNS